MLQPLRNGAARIALCAAMDDGTPSVVTVAVGLVYDAKARFRSRALVRVGPPVAVQRWAESYRSDARAAVRELTDDLAGQLRLVSPSYQSWQQAALLARVAEVAGRPLSSRLTDVELADQERVAQLLAAVESSEAGREQLGELRQTFVGYERDLAVLGLNDAQLAASYQNDRLHLALLWSAAKVIFALPVAALGAVIHIVPYQLMKRVATRPANESIKATVKLLGCFTSFMLVYSMLAIAVARWRGLLPAGAVFAAAPLCGYTTVRLVERLQRIGGLLEGYRVVRQHRNLIPSVLATRLRVSDLTQTALAIAPRNSDPFRPIT